MPATLTSQPKPYETVLSSPIRKHHSITMFAMRLW